MDKNINPKDPQKNDNFFNKNPLLVFAIFSIVTVLIFKALFEDGSGEGGIGGQTGGSAQTQSVSYYELKKLVEAGKVEYVGIGEGSLKASSKGEPKVTYVATSVS